MNAHNTRAPAKSSGSIGASTGRVVGEALTGAAIDVLDAGVTVLDEELVEVAVEVVDRAGSVVEVPPCGSVDVGDGGTVEAAAIGWTP